MLERLIAAGLDSIPGGGAEILEDDTRRRIWSRAKASTEQWLEVHRQAHELGLRTTATMMFGVGEPLSARIHHFLGVRQLQDETGGFTAFIPWTFQDQSTDLEGEVEPSGGYDYLRTLAISRLALDNITHVQGSWVTQGKKIGQLSAVSSQPSAFSRQLSAVSFQPSALSCQLSAVSSQLSAVSFPHPTGACVGYGREEKPCKDWLIATSTALQPVPTNQDKGPTLD